MFSTSQLITRSWKIKSLNSSYWLEIEKLKVLLRVSNPIGKLLFFQFRVTNSKLLIRKIERTKSSFRRFCYFLKKVCFVVIKYTVFIWILGFQWLMQYHRTAWKCPNTEFFLVRIFLYSDWTRILVNLRIQSEYRKIRTWKNSVFGHF